MSNSPPLDETLFAPLAHTGYDGLSEWAWSRYRSTVLTYVEYQHRRLGREVKVLEVGAGRSPLFSVDEAAQANMAVTLNDISEDELQRAPHGFASACFDVGGQLPRDVGGYDLIVSKMVLEHVQDTRAAWRNIQTLLEPSGISLAFIPTLYSPPFVLNKLVPDRISRMLLERVFPNRSESGIPKFPARYDHCTSDERSLKRVLTEIGFTEVLVLPFWTHNYFSRFPLLREADHALQLYARRKQWRLLSTYAYVIVRK